MNSKPAPPTIPQEEEIRKLAGRELAANVSVHVFGTGARTTGVQTLDDAREAEELVVRKLGLSAYTGALLALLDNDVPKAIVASPQHRLRACLLALKRDAEETGN